MRVELIGTSAIIKIRLNVNENVIRQSGQINEYSFNTRRDVIIIF
jgi:hypothetical protein